MRRLTQLRDLLSDERVAAVLTNPTIPIEQRMDVITSASLDPETTNLAKLLIEANRVREIGAVADQFENLADDAAGRVRATITTAVKLAPRDRDRVAIQLSERLGQTLNQPGAGDPRHPRAPEGHDRDPLLQTHGGTPPQQPRRPP